MFRNHGVGSSNLPRSINRIVEVNAYPLIAKSTNSHHLQSAPAPQLILRVPPRQFKQNWPQLFVVGYLQDRISMADQPASCARRSTVDSPPFCGLDCGHFEGKMGCNPVQSERFSIGVFT